MATKETSDRWEEILQRKLAECSNESEAVLRANEHIAGLGHDKTPINPLADQLNSLRLT